MLSAIIILALGLVITYVAYRFAPQGLRTVMSNVMTAVASVVGVLSDSLGVVDLKDFVDPSHMVLLVLVITIMNGFFRSITTTPMKGM